MKKLILILVIVGLGGCTIKNHILRGAVNGVLAGPVVVDNINEHDGYVDDQDPRNLSGSFVHDWMLAGFCFTGNPIMCGAFLGSNAILGAIMTHHHFKKLEKKEKP